ncbi:MAG: hypothetical protein GF368_03010 [Candidatus Aenigmarchaeota archaeon]|nr:hypothetical protein [Candidatus Aenigmarchaeota archaeon]
MRTEAVIEVVQNDDVLVCVHPEQATRIIKGRIRELNPKFGPERVYYSQSGDLGRTTSFHTYSPPYTWGGNILPPPDQVGKVYIAGAFRDASVYQQKRWLEGNGYDTILVDDAIEGNVHV